MVIENPVVNSPHEEPKRHFFFSDGGITDKIVEARRLSSYFIPIPRPKKKGKQLAFETEWTAERKKDNEFINALRGSVAKWRFGRYAGVTRISRQLLEYWQQPDRDRRLYFCQIEALETAIYLAEAAEKQDGKWILQELRRANAEEGNSPLYRIAFKMATGSGKTVVMGMLIAWQTLNKLADPKDDRFSDAFLVVTPGITIRDRLRVLFPNDPDNYYRKLDLLPEDQRRLLPQAKIIVTNFHAFLAREKEAVCKLTRQILGPGESSPFTESPEEMVRRVCRGLGGKKNIVVINDEAHHCYRGKPEPAEAILPGEERRALEKREHEARVWITGLEAVKRKLGIKVVYDLSATPFLLRGSGYPEGTLFPWVVSDFSLIDAIEAGIVKIPRVPVADNAMVGDQPTYRDLWYRIRDHLPRKGRGTEAIGGEPKLPAELEGALHSLYNNYKSYYRLWDENAEARARGQTPPVFIVVCSNTNVSKLVFDYIAGWEKKLPDGATVLVPGKLELFSNVEDGRWSLRPTTILVDSEQLESGEAMSDEFRRAAAREIDEFKEAVRARFPEQDVRKITDEDLLGSWEQKLAQALESMDEVASYFKNHNAGFTIPYTFNGEEHSYLPDFVARLSTPGGPLNLILEVTGQRRAEKAVKVATSRTLWVPAVNNQGGFGCWAFLEIRDPWNAQTAIREFLDIDLLVEFQPDAPGGLLDYTGLMLDLSEVLHRRVDLVEREALKPLLRKAVLSEACTIYAA